MHARTAISLLVLEARLERRACGSVVGRAVLPLPRLPDVPPGRVAHLHDYLLRRRRHLIGSRVMEYLHHSATLYHDVQVPWLPKPTTQHAREEKEEDELETGTTVLRVDKSVVAVAFTAELVLCFRLVRDEQGCQPQYEVEDGDNYRGMLEATLGHVKGAFIDHIQVSGWDASMGGHVRAGHASAAAAAPMGRRPVPRFRPKVGDMWGQGQGPGQEVNDSALAAIKDVPGGHAGLVGVALVHLRGLWQALLLARIVRDPVWVAAAPLLPAVATAVATAADTAVGSEGGDSSTGGVAHALLRVGVGMHVGADGCGRYEVVREGVVMYSSSSYARTRDALLCHTVCDALVGALDGVAHTYATRVCGTSVVVGAVDGGAAAAAAAEVVVTLMPRPGREWGVVGTLVGAGGAGGSGVRSAAVEVEAAWLLKTDFQGLLQKLTHG